MSATDEKLLVKVTHHLPHPDKYSWEIREVRGRLPLQIGRQGFRSWQQAYRAGSLALKNLKNSRAF
jgi:hypothetical protein